MQIGPPVVWSGGPSPIAWGSVERSGRLLRWADRTDAELELIMTGHSAKFNIKLLQAPAVNQFAFRVSLNGLTRDPQRPRVLLADGRPVMRLRPMFVYDAANEADVRRLNHQLVNHEGQRYVVLTLPDLSGMAEPVIDPTYETQPDAAAGKDTYIEDATATTNYGNNAALLIGDHPSTADVRRGLIEFDLSPIPDESEITSAVLWLYDVGRGSNDRTMHVYPFTQAWTEGDGTAGSGATWNTYDGSTAWPGGAGAAGDVDASIGSHLFTGGTGAFGTEITLENVTVKEDMGAEGWLLQMEVELDDQAYCRSSDRYIEEQRPKLTVEYVQDALASRTRVGPANMVGA